MACPPWRWRSRRRSAGSARAGVGRGYDQLLQVPRLEIAGDVIEQLGDIAAELRVGGEIAEVGVNARRHRVIISGPEVAIGAEALFLAADDHRDFGVGLPVDEPVDDLDSGALQRV